MAKFTKYFSLKLFGEFLASGTVGVELFFVISGFIIAYVSLNPDFTPKTTIKSFLTHRFVRIIPFMWICIIGYALLRVIGRGEGAFPFWGYLRAFFLFPIGEVEPRQIWTLRYEFLFYFIYALTVISVIQKRWLLIFWFCTPFIWYLIPKEHLNSTIKSIGDFLFSIRILLFGFGLLVAILTFKKQRLFHIGGNYTWLLSIVVSVPLLFVAYFTDVASGNPTFISEISTGFTSALILILMISVTESNSILNRFGLLLGNASYAIYLTHSGVISALLGFWSKHQKTPNQFVLTIVTLIACCLVGILTYKFIEKPIVKKAKQLLVIRSNRIVAGQKAVV